MEIKIYPKGANKQLSGNFRTNEFDCRCADCPETWIDEKLVAYLQRIRDHFGAPVVITSAYRCKAHNAAVNGAPASRHMKGQAADIKVQGISPGEVARYAESIGVMGIGLYDTFVHIDTRTEKAFWYGPGQEYRSTFGGGADLPALGRGDRGDSVRALQILLMGYGYSCGAAGADGIFGAATENAVECFREDAGLTAGTTVSTPEWHALLGL